MAALPAVPPDLAENPENSVLEALRPLVAAGVFPDLEVSTLDGPAAAVNTQTRARLVISLIKALFHAGGASVLRNDEHKALTTLSELCGAVMRQMLSRDTGPNDAQTHRSCGSVMEAFQRGITVGLALDKAPMVNPMKESPAPARLAPARSAQARLCLRPRSLPR